MPEKKCCENCFWASETIFNTTVFCDNEASDFYEEDVNKNFYCKYYREG